MSVEAVGEPADETGGPMWGRFFDSIGGNDADSVISGQPSNRHASMRSISVSQMPRSPDLRPDDSASAIHDEDNSVLDFSRRGAQPASIVGLTSAAAVDDGTYVFKFRTPSGRTHRFQSRHDNYEHMREIVSTKLAIDPFFTSFASSGDSETTPDPGDYHLAYTDADEDVVLITSDSDVTDAVKMARSKGLDRVVLFIQGGKGWEEATAEKIEAKAAETAAAARQDVHEVEKTEEVVVATPPSPPPPTAAAVIPPPPADGLFGIPRDMVLPTSIGVLAASIVVVFAISKFTSSSSNY